METIFESQSIRVVETTDTEGEVQRQLFLGPPFTNVQGAIKVNRPEFHVHQFSRNLALGALCVPGGVRNALFLGMGAGVIINTVRQMHPQATIDIVDINYDLFEVANKFFFNIDADNVNLFHEDAYGYIQRIDKQYDFICCDIWTHSLDVPDYMAAGTFSNRARELLSENGLYAINTNRTLLKTIAEPLTRDFNHVFSLQGNNCLLWASNAWPDFIEDADVIAHHLSNNIDITAIQDNMVLMQQLKRSGLSKPPR